MDCPNDLETNLMIVDNGLVGSAKSAEEAGNGIMTSCPESYRVV